MVAMAMMGLLWGSTDVHGEGELPGGFLPPSTEG